MTLIEAERKSADVVDGRGLRQPFRTGSSSCCACLDRSRYIATLPNQGHAGEYSGPQIDSGESENEHCAAVGICGDLHLVLLKRVLLIGADVIADLVRPKTFIERNAYLISVHWIGHPFSRESIEHDADLARRALICDAICLIGLLQRVAVRDDAIWVKVPAHQMLKQFFHVTQ